MGLTARCVAWSVNYGMSIYLNFKQIIKAQAVGHQSTPDSRSCFWETLITPSIIFVWQERKREKGRRDRAPAQVKINSLFCSTSTWSEPRGPRLSEWSKSISCKNTWRDLELRFELFLQCSCLPSYVLSFVWPHAARVTLYHLHRDANIMSCIWFWFIRHSTSGMTYLNCISYCTSFCHQYAGLDLKFGSVPQALHFKSIKLFT